MVIQAFTFGSTRDSVIQFPDAAVSFEKIYMYYTLRCHPPPGVGNPPYPCGEWDYLSYTYIYIPQGVMDSSITSIDTVTSVPLVLDTTWHVFEVIERFELGRFITPYGIGLDLDEQGIDGGNGFTWVFDVSDYRPLLTGAKRITAGNWQELLDLKFVMIEGVPPRKVLQVENLWSGSFGLPNIATTLAPKNFYINPNGKTFRIKTRTSGHGHSNSTNCAEFCKKTHHLFVNGTDINWELWDECSTNPVYPQGGTWLFDRAGWCPGAFVNDYNHEITPYVTPGSQALIDYDVEPDVNGNYVLEVQLISYSAPNFTHDVAMEDIIAPSKADIHNRLNPICRNPIIKIKNTGSEDLQSALISYGVKGGDTCYYLWEGTIKFLESAEITLPKFNWAGYDENDPEFYAKVNYPNNKIDEYEHNNTAISKFIVPDVLPEKFRIYTKPDNYYDELSWTIEDEDANIIKSSPEFTASAIYIDTVELEAGCYVYKLEDSGDDGLGFWFYNAVDNDPANINNPNYQPFNVGSGHLSFRRYSSNANLKLFNPDFGRFHLYHFTVGHVLGQDSSAYKCDKILITPSGISSVSYRDYVNVYPNPSTGIVTLDISLEAVQDISIRLVNLLGREVYTRNLENAGNLKLQMDLSHLSQGIYILSVRTDERIMTKELVLTR